MRTNRWTSWLIAVLCVFGLAACESTRTSQQRAERTTATLTAVDENVDRVLTHMRAADDALDNLMRERGNDVVPLYREYASHVDALAQDGERLISNAEQMVERGRTYFAEWERQEGDFANPAIQQASEQRRDALGAYYDRVIQASRDVRQPLESYISDHRELSTFLSNDLTPGGIAAAERLLQELRRDSRAVRAGLARMQRAVDQASSEMARGGMATGAR
jgi:ElaB/YqjD/DUF883 family membrane-anchored ribosome-binding protein